MKICSILVLSSLIVVATRMLRHSVWLISCRSPIMVGTVLITSMVANIVHWDPYL